MDAGRPAAGAAVDEAAFSALVREHADSVYGAVLRRVGERALAENLAQETFLRAWRGRAALRDEGSARAWLLAIALNVVRDEARRRKRRPVETSEEADPGSRGADPAVRAEIAERMRRMKDVLAALPEHHREMFVLRERDGLSYREIARALECPIGTVMSGLARARRRLLEALG